MQRTLIGELESHVGETVSISGWVDVRRDQGKMVFFDLRDRSGVIQGVCLPASPELQRGEPGSPALETAKETGKEYALRVEGVVNKRPEKNAVAGKVNGDIELEIKGIEILSKAEALPFDLDTELTLETLLDYRPLTLRRERERAIFKVQAAIVEAYRASLIRQGFTEFQAPALVGSDAEGGAEVFKVDYFNDKQANLATSPQFYKQIMTGVFERAFTIARVFRAEKSATTRHISELTQMDFEMAFIEDEREVMAVLERVIRDVAATMGEHEAEFSTLGASQPLLPEKPFPVLTLREAQETIGAPTSEPDLEPAHERAISEWAAREHGSDFVFITRFPTHKRAFYTYEHETEAPHSRGFDLLFRGLEINSGAQRIHRYDELVKRIEERGMDPKNFGFYLQAFKYGMPPHGGSSTGLERLTMKMLGLENVKEATLFPRDMNRIDVLLSRTDSDGPDAV